ncbi:MAG: phage major capsid protein [Oscillospiraceae bacterium]|nr:phage major capsid protein [Oscillospiraceae bacterium]
MPKILELREKRARLWETAKNFLDEKRGADGLVSPADAATYDKMEADMVALGQEIERLERQQAHDLALNQATTQPIFTQPGADNREAGTAGGGRATAEYGNAFWNAMRVRAGEGMEPAIRNALRIGADPEGGYLVPDEFERRIVQALQDENIFRGLANVITTSSGDRKIPVEATTGEAFWLEEGQAIPESDNTFGQVTIGAYKLGTMLKVSEELLNDSAFDMESYIASEFARRTGSKEEAAFINGDGKGKPTGILAESGGGQVGVTAAGTAAITLDEMIELFHSLRAPYRRSASFIMNDATVKAIRKLKDNNGQYLWQPSLKANTPDTILNRPVRTSAYMPTLAAGAKPIVFGDFRYYWVADRQGRIFRRLNELFAVTGQVGFIATQRVDGKLILPEAVKILKCKGA